MPAQSKKQRRLFAIALKYKLGEFKGKVSDDIKELSKLPEKTLRDFAETSEKDLPEKIKESREPSSGASGKRAGGGFPFGYEFGIAARQAYTEFAYYLRDKNKDKTVKQKGEKPQYIKTFNDFLQTSKLVQEMEATPTNTPGMGNVQPGEIGGAMGSGDRFDNSSAKEVDDWDEWEKKRKKMQKKKKKKRKPYVQRASWEIGNKLPNPVVNVYKN